MRRTLAVATFLPAPLINMIRTYKGIVEHTYATACHIVPQIVFWEDEVLEFIRCCCATAVVGSINPLKVIVVIVAAHTIAVADANRSSKSHIYWVSSMIRGLSATQFCRLILFVTLECYHILWLQPILY